MDDETLEHYRARARAECEAALNATNPKARHAHAEMADAYKHLVEIAELERRGELPPGKVASMAEALRRRAEAEFGGHAPKPRARPDAASRRQHD